LVGIAISGISILINNVVAVVIGSAVYTLLKSSVTGRGSAWAVVIIQTLYAPVLRDGTSRSSNTTVAILVSLAIKVGVITARQDTHEVLRALAVFQLRSSPLGDRAVSVGCAFYAATSLESTARSAGIFALVISGTEVDANASKRIAVRVDVSGGRRSIVVLAGRSSVEEVAVRAASIIVAVEHFSGSIAIVVGSTFNTSSGGKIALRLVRSETSILEAVNIGSTSFAREILHTVVSVSCSSAARVIVVIGWVAFEGINAKSVISANSVDSRSGLTERSIVSWAIKSRTTSSAATILHAIRSGCIAVVVAGASPETKLRVEVAKSLSVVVSVP